jgi:hypothetical protein
MRRARGKKEKKKKRRDIIARGKAGKTSDRGRREG